MKNDLIILGRLPKEGLVKTRLGQEIGYGPAAEFYRICLEHLILQTEGLLGVNSYFYYADLKDQIEIEEWLDSKKIIPIPPTHPDINRHLLDAFAERFGQGADKVVCVGSDIPDVSAELLTKAFKLLDQYDLVIGPDNDGGIYLFGCKKFYSELFTGDYADGVLSGTLQQIKKLGLNYQTLPVLVDIDTLQDLKEWQKNNLDRTHPAKQFNRTPRRRKK